MVLPRSLGPIHRLGRAHKLMYSLLAQEDEKNKSSIVKSSFITPVSYQTIAFVCGKDIHDSTSIRAKFIQHCTDNHIEITPFLAEDAVEKEPFGLDYLTQEKVIASFSGAIVIAVESFGSACELGTFSYVDSMAKKIYILDEAENLENDSFIKCGPIEKINRLARKGFSPFFFWTKPHNQNSCDPRGGLYQLCKCNLG